nr:fatty acid synthase-like [Vespula vulgaris]
MTRKLYADLRHFVVFSSVLCGRENAGQTNYGMANFIIKRIYEKRVKEDLLGLTIQWGVIGDVGFVADMQNKDKELVIVFTDVIVAEKRAESDINNVVDTILTIIGIIDLKNVSS